MSFHNRTAERRPSSSIVSNLKKVSFHNCEGGGVVVLVIVSNLKKVSFHNGSNHRCLGYELYQTLRRCLFTTKNCMI